MDLYRPYRYPQSGLWFGLRCLLGLAAVGTVLGVRLALAPAIGTVAPTLLFIIAVVIAAGLCSWWMGAVAAVVSGVLADYFFLEPVHTFFPHKPGAFAQLLMFYLVSGLVIALVEGLKQAGLRSRVERQRLSESEQFQHAVLDALLPEMAVLDHRGVVIAVNESWKRFARENGVTEMHRVAEGVNYLEICRRAVGENDEMARRAMEGIAGVLNGSQLQFAMEYACPLPGRVQWFLMTVVPLHKTDGGAVISHIDISERKEAELERVQLLAGEQSARIEAETANRAKDDFLATLSHELRTPLTAIMGWAQMLQRTAAEPEEIRHGLEVIVRNAVAQAQIVDDLLDVSHIIRGRLQMEARPVDLAEVLNASIDSVRLALEAKSLQLVRRIDPSAGLINGDRNRLQQVVWNLLTNAIKFTPEGGRIEVGLMRTDSHIHLSVGDTGIGIKPEFLPYLFERFRQADSSRKRRYGGLGLGLAIVRHLVELHGGTVHAESAGEGKGATFVIELPLIAANGKTDTAHRSGGGVVAKHANGPRP